MAKTERWSQRHWYNASLCLEELAGLLRFVKSRGKKPEPWWARVGTGLGEDLLINYNKKRLLLCLKALLLAD